MEWNSDSSGDSDEYRQSENEDNNSRYDWISDFV